MKITVIGAGNMGGALIKGWAKATRKAVLGNEQLDITITAHSQKTLDNMTAEFPELHTSLDNKAATVDADLIVLAVKPWLIKNIINEISSSVNLNNQIIVSVAANILTSDIRNMFAESDVEGAANAAVFYAMPNIAAEFGESMTFLAAAEGVSADKTAIVENLFSLDGAVKVCDEHLVGAGMMMAGCGIAYVMRFIRAMMEGGVEMGFYPNDAQLIAQQTMKGAITLLSETGLHPEAAIDKVTTPGGTTIKGLNELDHSSFNSAVIRCLKAGLKK